MKEFKTYDCDLEEWTITFEIVDGDPHAVNVGCWDTKVDNLAWCCRIAKEELPALVHFLTSVMDPPTSYFREKESEEAARAKASKKHLAEDRATT